MIVEIPSYKYIEEPQQIDLTINKICTLMGGNGSGKSTILESIFANYNEKIISFSSGQNELFTKIYNNIKSSTFKKIQNIDTNLEEIKKYHFHYEYSRILVFVALSLKNGLVRKYLNESSYIDTLLSNTFLDIDFELPDYYIRVYTQAREKETMEPEYNSIIKTYIHKYIERIIENKINNEYDFDKAIKKRTIRLTANDLLSIFDGKDSWKIFTFISLTNNAITPIFDYKSAKLLIKNDLEFEQLSDGEYQLLSIYALIDLFDDGNTIFLFDEVDSHLHYENINKLWDTLKNINGKLINTTHIADSIVLNCSTDLRVIEEGIIHQNITASAILERLENLSHNKTYQFHIASKFENIALVENYTDWLIFKELCKIKIDNFDENIFNKIQYINCSSGYDMSTEDFANNKIKWYCNYQEVIKKDDNLIKNLFMVCDRDNLPLKDIKETDTTKECKIGDLVCVKKQLDKKLKKINSINTHLLSWRRREIENYLISYTMLKKFDYLTIINNELPAKYQLKENSNMDNIQQIQTLDIKSILNPLYSNIDGKYGICYNTLKDIISFIPKEEISQDIEQMYKYLKDKVK